jgi:hypothetical protein
MGLWCRIDSSADDVREQIQPDLVLLLDQRIKPWHLRVVGVNHTDGKAAATPLFGGREGILPGAPDGIGSLSRLTAQGSDVHLAAASARPTAIPWPLPQLAPATIKEPLLTPIDQHFPRAAWGNPPAPSGTPVPGDGRVLPPAAGGEGAVMPPIQRAGSEPGGTPQVSVEAPI